MKQRSRRVRRFIGVIFVEEILLFLRRIGERSELLLQNFDLLAVQHSHTRNVSVLLIERDLVVAKAKTHRFFFRGNLKETGNQLVTS